MLISLEPYKTCDFPGGLDPYPPLDLHIKREAVKLIETYSVV